MNRSYSKIRHIQKVNLLLENKLLKEQDPPFNMDKLYPPSESTRIDNSLKMPPPVQELPRPQQHIAKADYRSQAERDANTRETQKILQQKAKLDQLYGNRHLLADNPEESSYQADKHTALTVLSIGAAFIPFA